MRPWLVPCWAVLLSALVLPLAAGADAPGKPSANWPQWRGPSGQGYVSDANVPLHWSETHNLLWKTKLPGAGHSTPILWGDRVFLTAASPRGADRYVLCFRAGAGKLLWQRTAATGVRPEGTHPWNGFASPSCVTDGSHVYAFFGTPGLFCYDRDGKLVWKHAFGTFTSKTGWGIGSSPVLVGDLVIQTCDTDGPDGLRAGADPKSAAPMALVALDKRSGKVRWTTRRDQGQGFSTPRLMRMADGRTDLVLNGPLGLWGYDPRTGKERWRCLRSAPGERARFGEPLPVNDEHMLFVLSGRPGPCQALRLPGSGDVTRSHVVWEKVRGRGRRDVASPILYQGRVYVADRNALLTCYDLKTGKELYAGRLGRTSAHVLASPVLVRGKLLFLLDEGTTVVVEPGPTPKVVARNKLGDGTSLDFGASPAVANGRLFLRSQSYLYCIGEKKKR
jgi:outer membrane protein assembly factor BamB